MRRLFLFVTFAFLLGCGSIEAESAGNAQATCPDPRFVISVVLARDDFAGKLSQWRSELEKGGSVAARDGALEIDIPGGGTVWFKTPFEGPLIISYDVVVVQAGEPNDRVSDLNCFWMARDPRTPKDLFATQRSGKFSEYDSLQCYYVGLGGNSNTTTRFRRYIGAPGNRPLLREHDLSAREFLITPNVSQRIQLVAAGPTIAYYRDGKRIFSYNDAEPYVSGWFAFRSTASHLQIKHFSVSRLRPK
jgi:hypothetical protein